MTDDRPIEQAAGVLLEGLRTELEARADWVEAEWGISVDLSHGKLLRPLLAVTAIPSWAREDQGVRDAVLWGSLAIQMVHEASLLHDDIVDGAPTRRGAPTLASEKGLAAALVQGDHLLTAAYRVALKVPEPRFLPWFVQAVERTVAGERVQASQRGRGMELDAYREMITRKSGDLFGAALVLPSAVAGVPDERLEACFRLGGRLGCLYQMMDDFLDFCSSAELGKPTLQDYAQEKWTWPLGLAGVPDFGLSEQELLERMFYGDPSAPPPMVRALELLSREVADLTQALQDISDNPAFQEIPAQWLEWARGALEREMAGRREAAPGIDLPPPTPLADEVVAQAQALGGEEGWDAYFSHHARSFRFAARLFPPEPFRRVSGVYAFCRFTDDLVDSPGAGSEEERRQRLAVWRRLTRSAYDGGHTGIPLLDEVMRVSAERGVPFSYVEGLLDGVEMDLFPGTYPDLESLRSYSYRVASVVGLWLTELFGVHDPAVLVQAETMGHAMQLTNILRDVGEDARAGRLYLPLDHLARHGVTQEELQLWALGEAPVGPAWPGLAESMLQQADEWYDEAFPGIPHLPPFFQRPVAVAARVYQGIHREIRDSGYDVFGRRNATPLSRKVLLGGRAFWDLRQARRKARAEGTSSHRPNRSSSTAPLTPLPGGASRRWRRDV